MSALACLSVGADPLRTVVVQADARDAELVTRIRGQTSDLDVELVVVRAAAPDADALAEAAALAELEGARVVVWFAHRARAIIVHVMEPAARAALVREVAASGDSGSGASAASARAEAAALVVRGALRSLARGGRIGVTVPPGEREPEPEPEPELPARVTPREPEPIGDSIEVRGVSSALRVSIGWQAVFDAETPRGQQGLDVRLGLGRGAWHVSLGALAGLPSTLDDDQVAIDVTRHALLIAGGVHRRGRSRLELGAGLAAGVMGFFRSSAAKADNVSATPSAIIPVFFASPELTAGLRLGGGLVLTFTGAADVLLPRPDFGYQLDGSFTSRHRFWPIEPRVGLALALRTY